MMALIEDRLHRADVDAGQIDSAGGSTQVPAIASRLVAVFPASELVRTDVLGSVGLGLAMDARRKFG